MVMTVGHPVGAREARVAGRGVDVLASAARAAASLVEVDQMNQGS